MKVFCFSALLFSLLLDPFVNAATSCTSNDNCADTEFCAIDEICYEESCQTYYDLLGIDQSLECTPYNGALKSIYHACSAGSRIGGDGFGWGSISPDNAVSQPFGQRCVANNSGGEKFICYDNSNFENFDEFETAVGTSSLVDCQGSDRFYYARFMMVGSVSIGKETSTDFDSSKATHALAVAYLSSGSDPFINEPTSADNTPTSADNTCLEENWPLDFGSKVIEVQLDALSERVECRAEFEANQGFSAACQEWVEGLDPKEICEGLDGAKFITPYSGSFSCESGSGSGNSFGTFTSGGDCLPDTCTAEGRMDAKVIDLERESAQADPTCTVTLDPTPQPTPAPTDDVPSSSARGFSHAGIVSTLSLMVLAGAVTLM